MSATRILATLGTACSDQAAVQRLAEAGATAFRLNFSHTSHDLYARRVTAVRAVEQKLERPLGILIDLQGPKLRIGEMADGTALSAGDNFRFDMDSAIGDAQRCCLPHPEIYAALKAGQQLLVDDGTRRFEVLQATAEVLDTKVLVGGTLSSQKGVNVPAVTLPITPLSDKDEADLIFALAQGSVDWVALSFVQSADDLQGRIRELIDDRAALMAKIERPAALATLPAIIAAADGLMVARGDLGVELPQQQVPMVQREIIDCCRAAGKPVVVATQMLESMIEQPVPTRAETSDVASAVFEQADAVMLSAETAIGKHPEEAVAVMRRIADATEAHPLSRQARVRHSTVSDDPNYHAVARNAVALAENIDADMLVVFSLSGATALQVARERPTLPVIIMTPKPEVRRRMTLVWGAHTMLAEAHNSYDTAFEQIHQQLLTDGKATVGQTAVIVTGPLFKQVAHKDITIRVLHL